MYRKSSNFKIAPNCNDVDSKRKALPAVEGLLGGGGGVPHRYRHGNDSSILIIGRECGDSIIFGVGGQSTALSALIMKKKGLEICLGCFR